MTGCINTIHIHVAELALYPLGNLTVLIYIGKFCFVVYTSLERSAEVYYITGILRLIYIGSIRSAAGGVTVGLVRHCIRASQTAENFYDRIFLAILGFRAVQTEVQFADTVSDLSYSINIGIDLKLPLIPGEPSLRRPLPWKHIPSDAPYPPLRSDT